MISIQLLSIYKLTKGYAQIFYNIILLTLKPISKTGNIFNYYQKGDDIDILNRITTRKKKRKKVKLNR